jgi:hypothetical protein
VTDAIHDFPFSLRVNCKLSSGSLPGRLMNRNSTQQGIQALALHWSRALLIHGACVPD